MADEVDYAQYKDETELPHIMALIEKDLSEPYSMFTYRFFIHHWPELCIIARINGVLVGAIVCKQETSHEVLRGYVAMLAVDKNYRKLGIGSRLVHKAIDVMIDTDCAEIVLEAEVTNTAALRLYENLGFARDKRLTKYYMNGVDAFRLKLWLQ